MSPVYISFFVVLIPAAPPARFEVGKKSRYSKETDNIF